MAPAPDRRSAEARGLPSEAGDLPSEAGDPSSEAGDPSSEAGPLSAEDRALLASLEAPSPTPYHRLNPLTKAVLAVVATLGAFVLGGFLAPAIILIALVLPGAVVARETVRLVRIAILVSLPITISVALVSIFTRPGTTILFTVGPFDATLQGAEFAGQVIVRLFVVAMALGLFGLTTEPRAFVADLERRGLSPRVAFAAAATLETAPLMVQRAVAIQAAQRARGLDTEGGLLGRLRGVLPLVGPVILGSLTEVEERSLALEVRAFGRPGRRHLLWAAPDDPRQRALRWALVVALVAITIGRVAGVASGLP